MRSVYYKYFHPKEVLVSNGVLNREINVAAGKGPGGLLEEDPSESLSFVYPFGATLTVQKPAVAVLSSGSVSYPQNRPVCAFYQKVGIWVYCGVPYVQYVCSTRRWAYGCTVVYHMSSVCVLPEGGHMGVLWCTIRL